MHGCGKAGDALGVNVGFYTLQDLTNVTVEHRNRAKPAFIIRDETRSLTNLFPTLNLTHSWKFLCALAVWSSTRRFELVRLEDNSRLIAPGSVSFADEC